MSKMIHYDKTHMMDLETGKIYDSNGVHVAYENLARRFRGDTDV